MKLSILRWARRAVVGASLALAFVVAIGLVLRKEQEDSRVAAQETLARCMVSKMSPAAKLAAARSDSGDTTGPSTYDVFRTILPTCIKSRAQGEASADPLSPREIDGNLFVAVFWPELRADPEYRTLAAPFEAERHKAREIGKARREAAEQAEAERRHDVERQRQKATQWVFKDEAPPASPSPVGERLPSDVTQIARRPARLNGKGREIVQADAASGLGPTDPHEMSILEAAEKQSAAALANDTWREH